MTWRSNSVGFKTNKLPSQGVFPKVRILVVEFQAHFSNWKNPPISELHSHSTKSLQNWDNVTKRKRETETEETGIDCEESERSEWGGRERQREREYNWQLTCSSYLAALVARLPLGGFGFSDWNNLINSSTLLEDRKALQSAPIIRSVTISTVWMQKLHCDDSTIYFALFGDEEAFVTSSIVNFAVRRLHLRGYAMRIYRC